MWGLKPKGAKPQGDKLKVFDRPPISEPLSPKPETWDPEPQTLPRVNNAPFSTQKSGNFTFVLGGLRLLQVNPGTNPKPSTFFTIYIYDI